MATTSRLIQMFRKRRCGGRGFACVSQFTNGERVDLWLIVGHSRDVSFHTPDVATRVRVSKHAARRIPLYPLVMAGMPETPMWTNTFLKEDVTGRQMIRVFWTWYNPESKENENKILWEAPNNGGGTSATRERSTRCTLRARCAIRWRPRSKVLACGLRRTSSEVDKALAQVCDKLQPNGAKADAAKPAVNPRR